MFKKYKISNFTGRINAFRVIKRLERMNILGGRNTESVKLKLRKILKFQEKICCVLNFYSFYPLLNFEAQKTTKF